jgi:Amidohydrolase
VQPRIFDFDNHYYESEDALTRHQDRALGNRGVRWADIGGRRRLLVGGKINSYIANPTFDPVARPLRLASLENGASWIPDLLHRLDDAANRNPGYFRDHSRDVFGEHVRVTPFWEDDVGALVGEVRADRLLLGSDWPHAEGTAAPADFVSQALAGLPGDAVRRIARDNALELLGVDVA